MTHWNKFSVLIGLALLMPLAPSCGTYQPFSRGAIEDDDTVAEDDDDTLSGDDDDDDDTATDESPTPEPPSFAEEVKPMLSSCTLCHASGAGASAWKYEGGADAYTQVMTEVNVSDPATSKLLIKASGGESHGGGSFYSTTSSEYLTILTWIEAGAPDN